MAQPYGHGFRPPPGFLPLPIPSRLPLGLAGLLLTAVIPAHSTTLDTLHVQGRDMSLDHSGVAIRVQVDPLTATDLPSLLAGLPGVQVRSGGGLGADSEASLRGSNGRQVRILWDGIPLTTGGGEATSLSSISPLLLEQVEVHKGRVPVEFDAGLAGSISLRSPDQLSAPVIGSVLWGAFGQRQAHLAAQLGPSLQFTAGLQSADNDFPIRNPFKAFDPTDPDRQRPEPRHNAATEQFYTGLRLQGPVEVNVRLLDDLQQLPTRNNAEDADAQLKTRAYLISAQTPRESAWQYRASYHWQDEQFRDTRSQIGLGQQDSQSETGSAQLQALRHGQRSTLALRAGHTRYSASDQFGSVQTTDASRHLLEAAGDITSRWRSLHLNGSLRAVWSRDETPDARDTHLQVAPALGLSTRLGRCIGRGNLGWRERLPTFFERYGDRGLYKGNPQLMPEQSLYSDIGLRCLPATLADRLEITLFGQDLRDAISPVFDAQGIGRSINTERATVLGIELSAEGRLANTRWAMGLTWQDTEDRGQVRSARGNQLPGRYTWQATSRLSRQWGSITGFYAFQFESGQYYDSANLLPAAPLRRHDIGVRSAIRSVGWSLQWQNLRDETAHQFNGFPTPGRRLLLSLRFPVT